MNKFLITFCLIILNTVAFAQEATFKGPEMADGFRENGKIYVVIGVIGIAFVCIIAFLIYLERRMKHLEEEMKNKR